MAKVLTFSTSFPSNHPRKNEPTFFVEKIYKSINEDSVAEETINTYIDALAHNNFIVGDFNEFEPKLHTIRKGKRFKVGDFFSPRIWGNDINPKSGRSGAYHSKQLIIYPDIEVLQTHDVIIYPNYEVWVDGKFYCSVGNQEWRNLSKNDGLTSEDMRDWFFKNDNKVFEGQIIGWSKSFKY